MLESQNKQFLIDIENNATILYVHANTLPNFINWVNQKNNFIIIVSCPKKIKDYTCFRFSTQYLEDIKDENTEEISHFNDCLRLSEELTCDIKNYIDEDSILKEKITGKIFGESPKKNINIVNDLYNRRYKTRTSTRNPSTISENVNINELANPETGESYAIVRTNLNKEGESPYHVAYVIYKDGTTNITIEADAGQADNKDIKFPVFDMYDTKNINDTFHNKNSLIYNPAVTIVLTSRGIKPILKKTPQNIDVPQNIQSIQELPIQQSINRKRKSLDNENSYDESRKRIAGKKTKTKKSKSKKTKSNKTVSHSYNLRNKT